MFVALRSHISINKHLSILYKLMLGAAALVLLLAPAGAAAAAVASNAQNAQVNQANGPLAITQESAQFTDPNPQSGDYFGYATSMSSDGMLAVVTAPDYTYDGLATAGAAYVFSFDSSDSTWTPIAQLIPTDLSQYELLGSSAAMSPDGSTIVVGAMYNPPGGQPYTQTGEAYVFTEPSGGWSGNISQTSELSASDVSDAGYFGSSVAISADGSTVVVGAKYQGDLTGEAYVYTQPAGGWASAPTMTEGARLFASDATSYNFFGTSVAVSSDGSEVVVGAPGAGSGETQPGAAYIFDVPGSGWSGAGDLYQNDELAASDGMADNAFGASVSLTNDGTMLLVGSPTQSVSGNASAGAAYVFNLSDGSWVQTFELDAADGAPYDEAGFSVAMAGDGTALLVGSPNHIAGGYSQAGASYIYSNNDDGTWSLANELFPTSSSTGLNFGWSVFLVDNSDTAAVGAPDLSAPQSGNDDSAGSALFKGDAAASEVLSRDQAAVQASPETQTTGGTAFSYGLASVPTITSLSTNDAGVGAQVTINGLDLQDATSVVFKGGATAAITSDNYYGVSFNVPTGAKTGDITLTTHYGTAKTKEFTVNPVHAAIITSFSPTSVAPGAAITLKGSHLTGTTQVTVNGTPLTITSNTSTELKLTVPVSTTTGYISVTTGSGTVTSTTQLTVLAPTISKLSPLSGEVGSTVIVKGADLAGVTQVLFTGGVSAKITSVTNTAVTVTVPTGAKTGYVTVVAPQGQAVSSERYTVKK